MLFSAAYESIMELLKSSPRDCYAVVQETTVTIIARLEDLLHHRQSSNEKTSGGNYNDLQSLLCATLQVTLAILNINVCVKEMCMLKTVHISVLNFNIHPR